jgi:hypothetical protein
VMARMLSKTRCVAGPMALIALIGLAPLAAATARGSAFVREALDQDQYERLDARVTAIAGQNVYLARGRVDQVETGDRIELYPTSGPQVRAIVRSVSKTSVRAELDLPSPTLVVGDRAEIWLPLARLNPPTPEPKTKAPSTSDPETPSTDKPKPDLPEHPPWESDLGSVDQDAPLLAPIQAVKPEERVVDITGRAWLDVSQTNDKQNGNTTIRSSRLGLDTTLTNAFGHGGELEFDAEFFERSFDPDDAPAESEDGMRVNRLNYLIGGDRYDPTSWQMGRFFSRGMSEFGLIDGLEWQRRSNDGNRWGWHVGALPLSKGDLQSGDDIVIGLFHHWTRDASESLTIDTGYQKSWHKGETDRDLLVINTTWLPSARTFVFGSAWIDVYDGSEAIKSSGPELTQFIGSATWRAESNGGVGLTLSHNKIPELLRDEFDELTATEILDSKVSRVSLYGYKDVIKDVELRARIDRWKDEEDSGGRLELSTSARNRLYSDGRVELAVFQDDNKFSSGPGLRLTATKNTPKGWLRLTYETARTVNEDFFGVDDTLVRDVFRASWDTTVGQSWDLSLNAEQRSGDAEDALTLGVYLQKRFR